MADHEKVIYDTEKGIKHGYDRKLSLNDRRTSIATSIIAADLFNDPFATTQRALKFRHAQMAALGGTIGTGIFVDSGQPLASGRSAFILVSYIIITVPVYFIV